MLNLLIFGGIFAIPIVFLLNIPKKPIVVLVSVVVAICSIGLARYLVSTSYEEIIEVSEYELVPLPNDKYYAIGGDEKPFYVYVSEGGKMYDLFYKDNTGEQKQMKMEYYYARRIHEYEEGMPSLVKSVFNTKNDKINKLWCNILIFRFGNTYERYEIFVPKGAMIQKYEGNTILVQEYNPNVK